MIRFKRGRKVKKGLVIAWSMIGVVMLFAWRYPYGRPTLDVWLGMIGIPAWSEGNSATNGVHYTAIVVIFIFIFALIELKVYYRGRIVFAIFIACLVLPPALESAYKSTFASNIYALDYKQDSGRCYFQIGGNDNDAGNCQLAFTNHSDDRVVFYITIKDAFSNGFFPIEKITGLKDHRVVIGPHQQKMFDIPFRVLVRPGERKGSSYTSGGIDVVVKSGGHTRKM